MIALAENSYGKSSVRVKKVKRDGALHTVKEWKVEVLLYGDFETCFTTGDNSAILPTDTMKNTVYSRARESNAECIPGGMNGSGSGPLGPSVTYSTTGTPCTSSTDPLATVCGDTTNNAIAGQCVECNSSADCQADDAGATTTCVPATGQCQ